MNTRDKTPRALVAELYEAAQRLDATETSARTAKIGDASRQSFKEIDAANAAVIVARSKLQQENNR